ncbi:hypothetical protein MNBD_UNCLBAC01-1105 [hydrothermal vent metagenome]|uniref:Glycosyltransferase n=1 Tax=hydrothermal vent metagenome TaxID=652676 RepID=A0A3B1DDD7_9ZZZZ
MKKSNWPTILYFGNDWSADNRTSSHHIARRLIRDHHVVYIECPGMRAPQGNSRDIKKVFSKIFKGLKGPRKLDEYSFVFTLLQIPFHKYRFVRALNRKLVVLSLRILCKKLKIKKPILWFVLPHLAMVLGKLNETLAVYYCIDDYSSLPGVNKKMITEMDEKMTRESDIVFVSAQPLLDTKKKYGDKVKLSRHGVDFDHFNQVYTKTAQVAEEVQGLKSPVIGFFGLIESWVDLNLIKFIAQAKPSWNIVLIGRVAVKDNPCESLNNVHFLGSRSYEELPKYSQAFDVAVIPCVNNELIYNFNPLKLREYLAMGKPVVSTQFPEIKDFLDVVEVADTYEEFLEKLEMAIKTDTPQKALERVNKVRSLSWENRFLTVCSFVEKELNKKKVL